MKLINLIGQRFGRLTVVSRHSENTKQGKPIWNCVCECGNDISVDSANLARGRTKSCCCLKKEMMSAHGHSHLTEFQIWRQMKERCYNSKAPNYQNYGGRGIAVCEEWKESFETFYRDMGPRPSSQHTLDRRENNKGYSKENCRWATQIEQLNNKRNNRIYEYNGESKTLTEWCRALNLKYSVIEQRIRVSKMSFERAITFIPPTADTLITIDGITKTLIVWCRERLIKFPMVLNRLFRGWTIEEALQPIASLSISYSTSDKEEDIETKILEQWCCLLDLDKNQIYLRVLRGETFEDIVKEL